MQPQPDAKPPGQASWWQVPVNLWHLVFGKTFTYKCEKCNITEKQYWHITQGETAGPKCEKCGERMKEVTD